MVTNLQNSISLFDLLHFLLAQLDRLSCALGNLKIFFIVVQALDVIRIPLLRKLVGTLTNVLDVLLVTLLVFLLLLRNLSLKLFRVLLLLLLNRLESFVAIALLLFC